MKKINIIVAVDSENGIGKNGDLAWKISKDMLYFKKITVSTINPDNINMVVMGRKTWESIPLKFRPLPGRINAVLTRNKDFNDDGCIVFSSIEEMLKNIEKQKSVENVYIIGGASIYSQILKNPMLEKIYITKIDKKYNCDVFFPEIPDGFVLDRVSEEQEEDGVRFKYEVYKRK